MINSKNKFSTVLILFIVLMCITSNQINADVETEETNKVNITHKYLIFQFKFKQILIC